MLYVHCKLNFNEKKMSAFSVELNTTAGQWTMSVAHTHLNQLREYPTSFPQHRLTHKLHWVIELVGGNGEGMVEKDKWIFFLIGDDKVAAYENSIL